MRELISWLHLDFPEVDGLYQDLLRCANYENYPLNKIILYYEPGPGTGLISARVGRLDRLNFPASIFLNFDTK